MTFEWLFFFFRVLEPLCQPHNAYSVCFDYLMSVALNICVKAL